MEKYELIATSAFGIEAVLKRELEQLGFSGLKAENGRISFFGTAEDIVRTNLWLRTADRVLMKIGEFRAESFDQLFDQTVVLPWSDLLPVNARIHVNGKSIKSKLFSVSDCQAIVKKAIIESLKKKYRKNWFSEDGPLYKIEVSLLKDIATITIDTSGAGLHKRGYREEAGDAPLKETLAAAMVYLSRWTPDRVLADPLCGSGTIGIEAALIAKNIAPGLNRSFIAEEWDWIPESLWEDQREKAESEIKDDDFRILCSDLDFRVLKKARENINRAGVEMYVYVQKLAFADFRSRKKYGCIITNPPYGERLNEISEVEKIYREMGETFAELENWDYYILTANEEFEKHFASPATKKRKLYNGKLKCNLYQYFSPKLHNEYLPEKQFDDSEVIVNLEDR